MDRLGAAQGHSNKEYNMPDEPRKVQPKVVDRAWDSKHRRPFTDNIRVPKHEPEREPIRHSSVYAELEKIQRPTSYPDYSETSRTPPPLPDWYLHAQAVKREIQRDRSANPNQHMAEPMKHVDTDVLGPRGKMAYVAGKRLFRQITRKK